MDPEIAELTHTIKQTLSAQGALHSIRAQLRACVLGALSGTSKVPTGAPTETAIALALIDDFLSFNGYTSTAASAASDIPDWSQRAHPGSLATTLGLRSATHEPLLLTLIRAQRPDSSAVAAAQRSDGLAAAAPSLPPTSAPARKPVSSSPALPSPSPLPPLQPFASGLAPVRAAPLEADWAARTRSELAAKEEEERAAKATAAKAAAREDFDEEEEAEAAAGMEAELAEAASVLASRQAPRPAVPSKAAAPIRWGGAHDPRPTADPLAAYMRGVEAKEEVRAKEEAADRQHGEQRATETAATPAPSTAKDATAGRGPAEVTAAEVAATTMELDESDDDDAGCDALPDLDAATDSDDGVGLDSSGDNAKPGVARAAAKGGSGGKGSGARPGAGPIVLDAETDEDDDDGVGLAQSRHVARSSGATGGTKRAVVWDDDDDDDDDAPNVACSNAGASAPVPTLAMDSDEADELEEEILEDMSDLDD